MKKAIVSIVVVVLCTIAHAQSSAVRVEPQPVQVKCNGDDVWFIQSHLVDSIGCNEAGERVLYSRTMRTVDVVHLADPTIFAGVDNSNKIRFLKSFYNQGASPLMLGVVEAHIEPVGLFYTRMVGTQKVLMLNPTTRTISAELCPWSSQREARLPVILACSVVMSLLSFLLWKFDGFALLANILNFCLLLTSIALLEGSNVELPGLLLSSASVPLYDWLTGLSAPVLLVLWAYIFYSEHDRSTTSILIKNRVTAVFGTVLMSAQLYNFTCNVHLVKMTWLVGILTLLVSLVVKMFFAYRARRRGLTEKMA